MSIDYTKFKFAKEKKQKEEYKKRGLRCKSKELAQLEKNRFSILTKNMTRCYICRRPKSSLHEIFRGRNRKNSMKYGLVVPLCSDCHYVVDNNREESRKLEEKAKKIFVKEYGNEKFLREFL
jgi:translation initiation factor IF-3